MMTTMLLLLAVAVISLCAGFLLARSSAPRVGVDPGHDLINLFTCVNAHRALTEGRYEDAKAMIHQMGAMHLANWQLAQEELPPATLAREAGTLMHSEHFQKILPEAEALFGAAGIKPAEV